MLNIPEQNEYEARLEVAYLEDLYYRPQPQIRQYKAVSPAQCLKAAAWCFGLFLLTLVAWWNRWF